MMACIWYSQETSFFLFFFNFDGFLKLSPGHHPCGCGYILHLLPLTLRWHTWRSVVVVTEGHGRGFAVWRLPVNSSIHTHYVLGLGKWSRVRLRMNIHFVWLPQRGSEAVENWRRRPASLRDYPLLLPSDVRCLLLAWVSAHDEASSLSTGPQEERRIRYDQ